METYLQANVMFPVISTKTSLVWLLTFVFQRILYVMLGLLPSMRYVKICWITIICHQCGKCVTLSLPLCEKQRTRCR